MNTSNSETQMERKRETKRKNPEERACYTVVSQQTLDLIFCPSKLNWISHESAKGAEVQHSRIGERERESVGWGLGERIRELEVLLPSEKKSERERERESERQGERKRERPTSARRKTLF